MKRFHIIAFTHKSIGLDEIGRLHVEENKLAERLLPLKQELALSELMYLSTCNRVEFLIADNTLPDKEFLNRFFALFNPEWKQKDIEWAVENCLLLEGDEALRHFFFVASSIDSLVVGEREIITQVRLAYEASHKHNLTGDFIRLVTKLTIETAKKIYTNTQIAQKPVSVVSLAFRQLKEMNIPKDARFIIVGAGKTNWLFAQYLKKGGFKNFVVFNRTIENAERIAKDLKAKSHKLSELATYGGGFDVLITCTGASDVIITESIYKNLVGKEKDKKIVVDLAIPNDLDPVIPEKYKVNLITIEGLKSVARENLEERQKEIKHCKTIIEQRIEEFKQVLRTRDIELALGDIPQKVKEIRERATSSVFKKELSELDEQSLAVLTQVLDYMEKKFISVPMKMAKEVLREL